MLIKAQHEGVGGVPGFPSCDPGSLQAQRCLLGKGWGCSGSPDASRCLCWGRGSLADRLACAERGAPACLHPRGAGAVSLPRKGETPIFLTVSLARTQPSLASSLGVPLGESPCPAAAALLPGRVVLAVVADFVPVSQKIQANCQVRVILISRAGTGRCGSITGGLRALRAFLCPCRSVISFCGQLLTRGASA